MSRCQKYDISLIFAEANRYLSNNFVSIHKAIKQFNRCVNVRRFQCYCDDVKVVIFRHYCDDFYDI